MKKLFTLLCITILLTEANAQTKRTGGPNSNIPKYGGRQVLANGIEGKKINFGFDLGGGVTMMDALNREAAPYGAKGSLFVHCLIPKTQTLGIGLEMGAFYLLANQTRFVKNITASSRDGDPTTANPTVAKVGNWLLPTAQASVIGNFHPVQRFNIQLKLNVGVVIPMTPQYSGEYWVKAILPNGTYAETKYTFQYDPKITVGFSSSVGMKMLYALNHYTEFGVGVDWSYLRFAYFKKWTEPTPDITKEVTQMGILDLHIGFAFSF